MREEDFSNVAGAVAGGAVAAIVQLARSSDDTDRRLRDSQNDATGALNWIRQYGGRGEVLRSRLPIVQDFQAGLSAATAQTPAPSVIPPSVPPSRPNLASGMESQVQNMQWPPVTGTYDTQGMLTSVGEMAVLAECLTFQEVRAILQGFVLQTQPNGACQIQLMRMANALAYQVCQQGLTWQQYQQAWANLFSGVSGPAPSASPQAHLDIANPPSGVSAQAGISNVTSLKPSTDMAQRWQFTMAPGNLAAGASLFTVMFNASFRFQDTNGNLVGYAPFITPTNPDWGINSSSAAGFTVTTNTGLSPAAATTYTVDIVVNSGVQAR